ncbi:MAG: Aureobasidin resistance protein Aur1 [Thelocarpon impressellum]|nr:MAG: Aureobasidin resistance protein Aur1 [Thelocarpon impressellum]
MLKKTSYFPSRRDRPQGAFSKAKAPLAWWPSIPVIVPHRFRRKIRSRLRSRLSPASSLSSLQTSLSPADTLRSLRAHRWSYYDGQYLLLVILGVFSLCVIESPGPIFKTFVASLLMASLLVPVTRQFFLPFLPIASWLVLFYACQFISAEYRPPIWVRVLPALENIMYGANLSNILSAHQNVVLDVLAWLPYGIIHFALPFLCTAAMFVFAAPGTAPVFARSFGYMNLAGVIIQLLFPCSPPWYENMFGLAPANYSMAGSPAGLARIDQLFGFDMYTSTFTASPMVFGAFPSLHAGCATIQALFLSHVFPRLRPVFVAYTLWIWWATMYLSHHYAVDLVGGSLLAGVVFFVAKSKFLPRLQPDKDFRWDYDYVEFGDVRPGYGYGLADLNTDFRHGNPLDDEWTVGSSSSISSGSLSPIDENSLWEGETLGSHSDSDTIDVVIDGPRR